MTVIVLLADGIRPDTLASALDAGACPALSQLRAAGGMHTLTSTFPSVTGPAYVPFLMGRFPGPIGLPGLRWFDRARTTCTFPDYTRSYVGYQMGAVNRDIDRDAPTIFELVPGSVSALSMITRGLDASRQLAALTPASAVRAAITHFRGDVAAWLDVDRDVSRRLIARVRSSRVPYAYAAFMGVDKLSHQQGHATDDVRAALRIIDDTVAALRKDAGDNTDLRIWVTSDHGHSPVSNHEDLERLIASEGFRVIAHPWVYKVGPEVAVMVSGNAMAHIYVDLTRRERPYRRGMSERFASLPERLLRRESVDLVMIPLDEMRCAVWSQTRGRGTVTLHNDRFSYRRDDGDPLRVGSDLSQVSAAEAHDATRDTDYPDGVVQIGRLSASSRAGDIMLSACREWDFRARYEPIPHVSSHGALHREHMTVPLLLDRPPSKMPRRTTDVFPSALQALGIPLPPRLDGESFI
jgi:hypothetical protein